MKVVYSFNQETRQATGVQIKDDDYVLQGTETLVAPDRTLYPPYTLNADGTAWSGLSLEEYQARNKPKPQPKQPTQQQEVVAGLMKTIAQMNIAQSQKVAQLQAQLNNQQKQIEDLQK